MVLKALLWNNKGTNIQSFTFITHAKHNKTMLTGDSSRSGVCAVCRHRDEANVTMSLTPS